jgi:diguanylate cyclase (GGDEF)-like protein
VRANQPLRVGFTYFSVPLLWTMVAHELTECAALHNMKMVLKGVRSADDQVRAVRAMIDSRIDAIILTPIMGDIPELLALLTEARAKDIAVVLIGGQELTGAGSFPLVRGDTPGGQALLAEYVFEKLGGKGKIAYVQARQSKINTQRVAAFRSVLARYPGIEVVKEIVRESTPHKIATIKAPTLGREWARQIIAECPDVEVIMVGQGDTVPGFVDYLDEKRLTERVKVTAFDGLPSALEGIRQGKILVDTRMPVLDVAKVAFKNVIALLEGKRVALFQSLPVGLITRDNVADVAISTIAFFPRMIELQQDLVETVTSSEERFRSLVELSSDWYWEQDEQCRFLPGEDSAGLFQASDGLLLWEIPGVQASDEAWREHKARLTQREPFLDMEVKYIAPDGSARYILLSGRPIFKQGEFRGYGGVAKDISERRFSEEQIEALAYYDALTSLPNRRLFGQHVDRALAQAKRRNRRLAVMFLDLDRFKNINDALGHEAGDELLCEISRRLRQCLREGDTISRFGGDEFVLLLEDIKEPDAASVIARKILAAVGHPVTIGNTNHIVTASIGISVYPEDGSDQQTLMKNADVAMYVAKERGKNTFQFYSAKANYRTSERLTLEYDLRKALDNQELVLHYQAKMELASEAITGVEALLRWCHPRLGLVPPGKFIPLAEESGLVVPIGKWALHEACCQIATWERNGIGRFPVAVNLSPRQFYDESLVADASRIIRDAGVDPSLLEFEITESMVMNHTDKAVELLMQLKDMGVRLAIDDFGTGYSSFGLLKRFPIDTIKIDRSFIQGIPADAENAVLANAMIAMGKALRLRIVAEGVEEQAQVDYLRELGCDEAQGFHIARPTAADEATDFLARHRAPPPNPGARPSGTAKEPSTARRQDTVASTLGRIFRR